MVIFWVYCQIFHNRLSSSPTVAPSLSNDPMSWKRKSLNPQCVCSLRRSHTARWLISWSWTEEESLQLMGSRWPERPETEELKKTGASIHQMLESLESKRKHSSFKIEINNKCILQTPAAGSQPPNFYKFSCTSSFQISALQPENEESVSSKSDRSESACWWILSAWGWSGASPVMPPQTVMLQQPPSNEAHSEAFVVQCVSSPELSVK